MKKTFTGETTYTFYGPGSVLCEFSSIAGTSTATAASANDRATYRTSDKHGFAVLLLLNGKQTARFRNLSSSIAAAAL